MLQVEDLEIDIPAHQESKSESFTLEASFEVPSGCWLSVIGHSGSGKSTLVNALAGFQNLESGSISLNGKEISKLPPSKRSIGIVFQQDTLFDHLSVEKNLSLALHDSSLTKDMLSSAVNDVLSLVKLPADYRKRKPTQLSGGEKARVSIARALLRKAKVIIFDESFSSLDQKLKTELQKWLGEFAKQESLSIISVTHDLNDARNYADFVLEMDAGKVNFFGAPNDFF